MTTHSIDSCLAIIDNDTALQQKLQLLADDAFNNNEPLLWGRHYENAFLEDLLPFMTELIAEHRDVFLDCAPVSQSKRMDYPHIHWLSKSDDEKVFIDNLSFYILVQLASEKQKSIEKYIEQLLDKNADMLPPGVGLNLSKEGLVDLSKISRQVRLKRHYDSFCAAAQQTRDPGGRIGTRFKLFKVSGVLDQQLVERLLYAFSEEIFSCLSIFITSSLAKRTSFCYNPRASYTAGLGCFLWGWA